MHVIPPRANPDPSPVLGKPKKPGMLAKLKRLTKRKEEPVKTNRYSRSITIMSTETGAVSSSDQNSENEKKENDNTSKTERSESEDAFTQSEEDTSSINLSNGVLPRNTSPAQSQKGHRRSVDEFIDDE